MILRAMNSLLIMAISTVFVPHGTRKMVDAVLTPASKRSPKLRKIFLQCQEKWKAIEIHRLKYIAQRKENAEVLQRVDFNTPVCSSFYDVFCLLL